MTFRSLLTEAANSASNNLGRLPTEGILTVMNTADAGVAQAVAVEIPRIAVAVDAIVAALDRGGSLVYIGAGTSGRLGVLDASECPPTFNTPPELVRAIIAGGDSALRRSAEGAEDHPEAGARDLLASGFGSADVLVGSPPADELLTCWERWRKPAGWEPSRAGSVARRTRSFPGASTFPSSPWWGRRS